MHPKISVIVPVYKAEKYLHRCVDSILAQTFTDFELILVNDGSPDNSGAICDEYAQKDCRVRVFHKENGGVSSARNLGLDNVRGEWVTFIDSDDYIHKDYLFSFNKNIDADLIVGSFQVIGSDENWNGILQCEKYGRNILKQKLQDGAFPPNYHGSWGKLFQTKIINDNNIRFDNKVFLSEDWLFTLNYFIYINSVQTIDKPYYYYERDVEESLSQNYRYFEEYFYAMQRFSQIAVTLEDSFEIPSLCHIYIEAVRVFMNRQVNYLYYNTKLTYSNKLNKLRTMLANIHVQTIINDKYILSKGPRRQIFDILAKWYPTPLLLLYIKCLRGNAY